MSYLSILGGQSTNLLAISKPLKKGCTRTFQVRKPYPGEVQQHSPIKNCIPKDKLWKEKMLFCSIKINSSTKHAKITYLLIKIRNITGFYKTNKFYLHSVNIQVYFNPTI
ncbi:MAG TPA: hypothetical protein DHM37_06695 [Candidatus Cloacimonas sp.]|nr:hypothetical protein [Candidatus Cloacimonas sp.]